MARPLEVKPPQSISIDLVPGPPESASAAPEANPPPALAAPESPFALPRIGEPVPTRKPVPPAASRMIEATNLFATGFLRDPANARIRRKLATIAPEERLTQLCNMEGLEQIRRADPRFDPDVLTSYAMADTEVSGLTLIADGGAFHSGGNWYAIRLRCTISPDHLGVTRFEFAIGEPIPRPLWASHGLEAEYQDAD